MKIALLTTRTPHHIYFARELKYLCSNIMDLGLVLLETKPFPYRKFFLRHILRNWYNPFAWMFFNPYMHIPYKANQQNQFELENFFSTSGLEYESQDGIPYQEVWSVNGNDSRNRLIEYDPDIILIYGTGLVIRDIFDIAKITSINCHGGWLPDYRGSDTNLWAAFKGDFDSMALAWHKVDATFDTGQIFAMDKISWRPDLDVVSLRYYTTLLATKMCSRLLHEIASGEVEARPQPMGSGRLYRFMPFIFKIVADFRMRRFFRRSKN